jgi:hypothetical protein
MKTLKSTLCLVLAAISFSCSDDGQIMVTNGSSGNVPKTETDGEIAYNRWDESGAVAPRYDGSDGGPIDNVVASSWIRNFNRQARLAAPATHYFKRQTIENILAQTGCTGIRIYYAVNSTNELKLIISGVDKNGDNILGEKPVLALTQPSVNENTAGTIDYTSAQAWIEAYQNNMEPLGIKSHYFGRIGIEVIFDQAGCTGLHIYHAMNDNDQKKLLIVGTTANSDNVIESTAGRIKTDLPITLNFSFPCPSTCSNGGDGGL